jgi:Skp family chaperone for outer membrane proteins
MSKSIAIGFLGVALIIFGMVRAEAGDTSNGKIGFVDLERTLVETKAGKSASKKFEQTRKKKQKELDKKQKELQEFAAQLEKQRSVLKKDVLKQRQEELEKMYYELQQLLADLERDLAAERAKLIQGILEKAAPVIKDIAKDDGYSMIVDRGVVLWAPDAADLTDKVNKRIK